MCKVYRYLPPPSLAGQLPGPPLKVDPPPPSRFDRYGLAGQLPGPPLKADIPDRMAEKFALFGRAIARPSIEGPVLAPAK